MSYAPTGSVVVGPVSQNSTATYVPVPGTILDLAQTVTGNATYVVQETGGVNGITFKVQASLDQVTWYDVAINTLDSDGAPSEDAGNVDQPVAAGTVITTSTPAAFSDSPFPGRYLQVCIEDTSGGSHGVAQITGYAH